MITDQKFVIGDVVGLVSGGPAMTVQRVDDALEAAQRPRSSDGRRKGRRRYGYKRFPSGDRRAK